MSTENNTHTGDFTITGNLKVNGSIQTHKVKGFSPVLFTDPVIIEETLRVDKKTSVATLELTDATVSSSATLGAGSLLPLKPEGYVSVIINGSTFKIPYYN